MSESEDFLTAIDVVGADAGSLLQGQLCNDLEQLGEQDVQLSGWINPAGRLIALLDIVRLPGGFRVFVPSELVETIVSRLTLYRLRAKAEISIVSGTRCWAGTNAPSPGVRCRALASAGVSEFFATDDAAPADDHLSAERHHLERLRCGMPLIRSGTSEKFTAHQLNLDRLGAVSLSKGCYSGQEIVARTEHLGRVKRRVHHLLSERLPVGDPRELPITSAGQKAGVIVDCAHDSERNTTELLAILPLAADTHALLVDAKFEVHSARLPFPEEN